MNEAMRDGYSVRENEDYLDLAGYAENDPGEWVVLPPPTDAHMLELVRRDRALAADNVRKLIRESDPRSMVMITNGREPGRGYGSILVIVGGPDMRDALHCPKTFGKALTRYGP